MNTRDKRAFGSVAWHECICLDGRVSDIQAEVRLSFIAVLAMAIEAVFRQNRAYVPIKVNGLVSMNCGANEFQGRKEQNEKQGNR